MGISTLVCSACFVLIPLALLVGVAVALPAWFPPLRSAARSHPNVRKSLAILAAVVAFALGYVGWARAYSGINYNLALDVYGAADCRQERCLRDLRTLYDNRDRVAVELWLRAMVPPPLRSACYGDDADLCAMADETYWGAYASHNTPGRTWAEYLSILAFSLLPTLAAVIAVLRLTVPRKIEPLRSYDSLLETEGPTRT